MLTLPPESIIIEERQRKDLGDIGPLADSISRYGQLNPIIVRPMGDLWILVAGERRLSACKKLDIKVKALPFHELSEIDAQAIEYEENAKRKDLTWKELVAATTKYHNFRVKNSPNGWSIENTVQELNSNYTTVSRYLAVQEYISKGDERILKAGNFITAYNIVERIRQRHIDNELSAISEAIHEEPTDEEVPLSSSEDGPEEKTEENTAPSPRPTVISTNSEIKPQRPLPPILCEDFTSWVQEYSGPKFNFAHCDFPYGIDHNKSDQGGANEWGGYEDSPETYKDLCQAFTDYSHKFLTPKCHVLFWFHMNYYQWTIDHFTSAGFDVLPLPLIWHKTDNKGILSDPTRRPRHIYETAFLISRGDRKIIQAVGDTYGCPTQKAHHLSEKPEPMLRHFFRMLVDEFSEVIDPTAGSGSALRAATSLGAKRVFGLEKKSENAEVANRLYLEAKQKSYLSEGIAL